MTSPAPSEDHPAAPEAVALFECGDLVALYENTPAGLAAAHADAAALRDDARTTPRASPDAAEGTRDYVTVKTIALRRTPRYAENHQGTPPTTPTDSTNDAALDAADDAAGDAADGAAPADTVVVDLESLATAVAAGAMPVADAQLAVLNRFIAGAARQMPRMSLTDLCARLGIDEAAVRARAADIRRRHEHAAHPPVDAPPPTTFTVTWSDHENCWIATASDQPPLSWTSNSAAAALLGLLRLLPTPPGSTTAPTAMPE